MLYFGEAPKEVVLLQLLQGGVKDDVCLDPAAHSPSLWVLAYGVDGVDDGVGEEWVASKGLVIHQPEVNHAAVGMDGVVWILCVVLDQVGASFELGG